MSAAITVYVVGSVVHLAGDVPAIVRQVCLRENAAVEYEVAWWHGGARSTAWVAACEVRGAPQSATTRIGFQG